MKTLISLFNISKKILSVLTFNERKSFILLGSLSFIVAILEVFGVALIMPFISIISNPEIVNENDNLFKIYNYLNFNNSNDFIIFLGVLYLFYLILSQLFKATVTYHQLKFIFMREASISKRLLESYLKQPYSWFLDKHSGDLGKSILSEVSEAIHYSINPFLNLISQLALALTLILLIIAVDPYIALISTLFILLLNHFIFNSLKEGISKKGELKVKSNKKRFTSVVEAFGAIKEIKLNGLENVYTQRFTDSAKKFAKTNTSIQIISIIPKYILETLTFGFLILFIIISILNGLNLNQTLPKLTLFAFAALRIVPSVQQIFAALSKIHFSQNGLNIILNQLNNLKDFKIPEKENKNLEILKSINIRNLNFTYPKSNKSSLNDINISIPLGSKIGLVGFTGSGKTTLVDIILGLLKPKKGDIYIDNNKLDNLNKRKWQNSIGYVPQQIYLTDKTISENIAFGIAVDQINVNDVEKAAKIAKIDDFIVNELENGYNTKVGERGVRLSGGQRQRIGIARALYNKPNLLILDEATSALDNITEKSVMKSINEEFENLTMIIIAHRLNTVRSCNCIYLLNEGKITSYGNYDDLMLKSKEFKKMVEI